jgi:hypothetical protein
MMAIPPRVEVMEVHECHQKTILNLDDVMRGLSVNDCFRDDDQS